MSDAELESRILAHVRSPKYRPVKPRVITKQLELPEARRRDVRKAIKRLAKRGELRYAGNHVVHPGTVADSAAKSVPTAVGVPSGSTMPAAGRVGIFHRAAGGFGFVRLRPVVGQNKLEPDVFVPANATLDAASGDLVRVQIRKGKRSGGDGRLRGVIEEVLARDTHQFVGTYRPKDEWGYVQVDGKVFAQPIPVGDPSAKNVQAGDKVVIEMIRFPSPRHEGEAVITEVLGPRGAPGVDTLSIIREFDLPGEFSEEVLDVARQQAEQFDPAQFTDRVDLTHVTVVTIDPADARDFDDAISLEVLDNGHWRLGVHIADVAHFVPAKSPLDQEARERATSVYLPDRVIPMLPEIISNHLASLQPHEIRFARTVFLELDATGLPIHTEVIRSAIRSDQRFNYEEVQAFLDDPQPWQEKLTPEIHTLLGRMHALAMVLRRRRLEHGAIELVLPEIKIELDDQGAVAGAHAVEHTESHQLIEEFMLAANEAVAQWLTDRDVPFLRRIHPAPAPMKLRDLTQFVHELGVPCEDLQSRFEIKRVLAEVEGRPEQKAVNYAILRAMQKAVYSPVEEAHYALNKTQYCHFTSPIRRYPDLTVHRLLDRLAAGKKPSHDLGHLLVLGEHCSEREQRAEMAERELVKLKLLSYLSQQIGLQLDAVVTGVEDYGLFVQGVQLPAEGLIHISSLQDDYYYFDAGTHSLTGRRAGNRYRLGDLIRVEVFHVDLDRRELDFRVITGDGPSGVSDPASSPQRQSAEELRRASAPQPGRQRGKPAGPRPGKPKDKRPRRGGA